MFCYCFHRFLYYFDRNSINKRSNMIKNDQKWSKMIKNDQIMWKWGFKNYISEMKIDQNHSKLSFSMVSINFYTDKGNPFWPYVTLNVILCHNYDQMTWVVTGFFHVYTEKHWNLGFPMSLKSGPMSGWTPPYVIIMTWWHGVSISDTVFTSIRRGFWVVIWCQTAVSTKCIVAKDHKWTLISELSQGYLGMEITKYRLL